MSKNDNRSHWQTCRAFHAYCLKIIKHTGIDLHRERRKKQKMEVYLEDLPPNIRDSILIVDEYFVEDDGLLHIRDMEFTPEEVAAAIHSLPDKKRKAVHLYYFENLTDVEIAKKLGIPRSTAQYRRTSSFEPLRKFLEGLKHGKDE